jgi:hypothetical protein
VHNLLLTSNHTLYFEIFSVPAIWQHTLSSLQDKCPHEDFTIVKDIIEREYQKPLTDIFKTIERTPIGKIFYRSLF